jgi:hypothetical protein
MRCLRITFLLIGPIVLGCGDDPFGVEDALGMWDLRQVNGLAISGTAPAGVWIRENGGNDSTLIVLESITLEFAADSTSCLWTFDDGIQGAVIEDDCAYAISQDGDISVDVGDQALQGTAEGIAMTLRDDATNELVFEKRT